jgi:RluA family pseudouridine synthase
LTKADILWEDTGSVFFNKPPGLLTQETRKERHRHVVPLLKAQLGYDPLYLCHRLDKDTSGVLLLAKTPEKLAYFMELFKTHSLAKTYWALVYGVPSIPQWQVKAPLSEVSPATGQVSVVSQGGRWAKTGFRLLAQNPTLGVSLIECSPQTGRTHQIRVHLEHSGYPLLGDVRYTKGARPLALPPHALYLCKAHHMLHAYGLQLPLGPATDHQRICAPPPKTFLTLAHMLQLAYPYHSPPFDCATVS